ncbi:MAG: hypothetical protein NDJ90_05290, partial [Oligoflexia bacterium]|nr:hypothetical protein [Oligoflexia bacterium]
QRALALEVGLGLEKWSVASEEARRSWRLDFPLPQGSTVGILPILRDRLTHELARKPLDAPVDSLWIEVLETAPGRGAQRDFFSAKEEEDEAVESLVARLLQKLGPSRAFTARPVDRYLPERAYERALETEAHGSAGGPPGPARPAPPRPTRLLGVPERIVARGELLQQPAVGKSWRVLAWEGPERLSGEWWREPFDRDYYRVATESGERLWVFRDRRDRRGASGGALYLHGYFD